MPPKVIREASPPRRSVAVAAVIGAGVMAGIDEIVFHQVLQWHHFLDRSTPAVGILTDGLLHALELLAIVGGFFLLADLRRRRLYSPPWAWSGFFLGAGGFQLFDGIVDHKLLRVHQIRYGVDPAPYDLAWNLAALGLLAIGLWLAWRAKGRRGGRPRNPSVDATAPRSAPKGGDNRNPPG